MRQDIHPKVYKDTKVVCACGNSFTTQSTLEEISVDICSNCHPFYTGKQKFVDTEGRIEKFQKKMKMAEERKQSGSKNKKGRKNTETAQDLPSLKEMLEEGEIEVTNPSKDTSTENQ